jgi:PAS domain S-box-containing protein
MDNKVYNYKKAALIQIVVPSVISVLLLWIGYFILIPFIKEQLLEDKKQQAKEMVVSVYSLVDNYNKQAKQGRYTQEEAKIIALQTIKNLRYGDDYKEYFWILDDNSQIISHPYFNESNHTNNTYKKNVLSKMVSIAKENGDGYYKYKWQWNDDANRVEDKISYFKHYDPWGWVIGTGFYEKDVDSKIKAIVNYIIAIMLAIIGLVVISYIIILRQTFKNVNRIISTENEVQLSERRFRHMARNLDSGLVIIENSQIVFANKKIWEILGVTETNIDINTIYDFLAPEEKQRYDAIISESRQTGKPIDEIGIWITTKDNKRKFISNRFSYEVKGKNRLTYIITNDITNRKEAELKLNNLTATIDQSPDSTVITDLEGNIVYVNKKFEEKSGYTFDELKGKNPRILKSGKMPPSLYVDLWKTISLGQVWVNELLNRRKNGELYWENTIIFPIRNDSGEIINYAAIKTDLTKQKQLEEELLKVQEEVKRSEKIKTAFLNNVSHEVNTPLNAIYGFSYLLRERFLDSDTEYEYLSMVINNTETLIKLFDDIMEFSAIESGNITINKKIIEITNLLQKITSKYNVKIIGEFNKNLVIQYDSNPDFESAVLITDKKWFTAIIEELLSNAIKFTESGTINLGFWIDYQNITFYVKDCGVGIREVDKEMIFNSFTHGDNLYVSLHQGTGLGLNIAAKLAEHLGGKLWFESAQKKGSTFYFSLPSIDVINYTLDNIEVKKSPYSEILNDKRILIAEDNEAHFNYLRSMINNAAEIAWAKNGFEVLQILEHNQGNYDFVFIDLMMPLLNGINTAKTIRTSFPKIYLIAVMSFDYQLKNHERKLFDSVLIKPCSKNSLYEIVNDAMSNSL